MNVGSEHETVEDTEDEAVGGIGDEAVGGGIGDEAVGSTREEAVRSIGDEAAGGEMNQSSDDNDDISRTQQIDTRPLTGMCVHLASTYCIDTLLANHFHS